MEEWTMKGLENILMEWACYAGNAKSMALQAVMKAENKDMEAAKEKLQDAKGELHKAHTIQTDLMTKEIQGEPIEKSILLIHAQDHFMAANTVIELAERFLRLYENFKR